MQSLGTVLKHREPPLLRRPSEKAELFSDGFITRTAPENTKPIAHTIGVNHGGTDPTAPLLEGSEDDNKPQDVRTIMKMLRQKDEEVKVTIAVTLRMRAKTERWHQPKFTFQFKYKDLEGNEHRIVLMEVRRLERVFKIHNNGQKLMPTKFEWIMNRATYRIRHQDCSKLGWGKTPGNKADSGTVSARFSPSNKPDPSDWLFKARKAIHSRYCESLPQAQVLPPLSETNTLASTQ